MRKLYLNSIWAPGAIPLNEWKYRNLKRVMFPIVDFFFFFAGISATRHGVPAISEFFPNVVVDSFAILLSASALVCFIGVAFPKLWGLEMGGKAVIIGLMVGFISSILILTLSGDTSKVFVLIVASIAVCPVVWRISLLGTEWQDRRNFRNLIDSTLYPEES